MPYKPSEVFPEQQIQLVDQTRRLCALNCMEVADFNKDCFRGEVRQKPDGRGFRRA